MSEKAPAKEMRRHQRYPTNFSLDIADIIKSGKKITAVITNISEGGMALETSQKMDVDSSLSLQIQMPLSVQGGVVRSEQKRGKYRYGVRFHNVRFQPMKQEFAKPRTMVRVPRLTP